MPSWRTALAVGGLLCLTATRGLCQSLPDRQIADFTRLVKEHPASSLAHYRLAEVYLREHNLVVRRERVSRRAEWRP